MGSGGLKVREVGLRPDGFRLDPWTDRINMGGESEKAVSTSLITPPNPSFSSGVL